MKNKLLAIKGHSTRGKEVIEILEMLGGINSHNLYGEESYAYYTIDSDNEIKGGIYVFGDEQLCYFTLEEFLEKYPYKIGDKCKYNGHIYFYRQQKFVTISNMCYMNDTILYKIDKGVWVKAENLQPFKEEIKAEDRLEIYADPAIDDDSKTDITIDGEKLIAPNGYTIGTATKNSNKLIVEYIKNKPQYPKTYEECCQITKKVAKTTHELDIAYNPNLIYNFQKLLICRDAYWKIACEEMGLSEPWKPSANDKGKTHSLYYNRYTDSIDKCEGLFESNAILDFPTKEMRDAFFENFKDLIEKCKEFL